MFRVTASSIRSEPITTRLTHISNLAFNLPHMLSFRLYPHLMVKNFKQMRLLHCYYFHTKTIFCSLKRLNVNVKKSYPLHFSKYSVI
ncbi:hypothetical protein HanRHA438_Chr08g0337161 [Helianthus annuus]|nr:hypothetical protein HanRHA438_Chr08g0337161 [Helianthus annuus]